MNLGNCESCSTPWDEHGGIELTCREVVRLRNALHAIMMVEHTLRDGRTSHVVENRKRRQLAVDALKGERT